MSKLLKPIILVAFLASLLLVTTTAEAQRGNRRGRYWNNYWSWYDNDYRPYYNRRGRNWDRNRFDNDRYWGRNSNRFDYGRNRYDYGRNRNRDGFGRRNRSGIQIGPLGVRWR